MTASVSETVVQASPAAQDESSEQMWKRAEALPCQLSVELHVPTFTVRDLFRLKAGAVIVTEWAQSTDVPFFVNRELIGWAEFEVVGDDLAVRVTEFAR